MFREIDNAKQYFTDLLTEQRQKQVLSGYSSILLTPKAQKNNVDKVLTPLKIYLNNDEIYYIDYPEEEGLLWKRLDNEGVINVKNKSLIRGFRTQKNQLLKILQTNKPTGDKKKAFISILKDYILSLSDICFLWENVNVDFNENDQNKEISPISLEGHKYTLEQFVHLGIKRLQFKDKQYLKWGFKDDTQFSHGNVQISIKPQAAPTSVKATSLEKKLLSYKDFSIEQAHEKTCASYFDIIFALSNLSTIPSLQIDIENPHGFYRSQLRRYYSGSNLPAHTNNNVFRTSPNDDIRLAESYNTEYSPEEEISLDDANKEIDPKILSSFDELINDIESDQSEEDKLLEAKGKPKAPTINYDILPSDKTKIPEAVLQEENSEFSSETIIKMLKTEKESTKPAVKKKTKVDVPKPESHPAPKPEIKKTPVKETSPKTDIKRSLKDSDKNSVAPKNIQQPKDTKETKKKPMTTSTHSEKKNNSLLAFSLPELINEAKKELEEQEKKQSELKKSYQEKENSLIVFSKEIKTLEEKIKDLEQKKQELNQRHAYLAKKVTTLQKGVESLKKDYESAAAQQKQAREILNKLTK